MEILSQYKYLANLSSLSEKEMEQMLYILEMAESDEILDKKITEVEQEINKQRSDLNEHHLKCYEQQRFKLMKFLSNHTLSH
jgi:hypothetical protein